MHQEADNVTITEAAFQRIEKLLLGGKARGAWQFHMHLAPTASEDARSRHS
jgi:hypothetical protein